MRLYDKTLMKRYANRRLLTVLVLGFGSGLPLALSSTTLQAWCAAAGLNLKAIGLLSLAGLPYLWKFIWAPALDCFTFFNLGRRRGWIFFSQLAIMLILIGLSFCHPGHDFNMLAVLALLLAFFSATQDIAINAYQTEILTIDERGIGAMYSIGGYRIAMLISGGLALIAADYIGWSRTYQLMAALMLIAVGACFLGPKETKTVLPGSLLSAVLDPVKEFFLRKKVLAVLLFIFFYKLGDAFTVSFMSVFFLRFLHFTLTQVGVLVKIMGTIGTFSGIAIGAVLLARWGLFRALWIFGGLQVLTSLGFALLTIMPKSYWLSSSVVFFESFASAVAAAALIGYFMALCDKRFTATQFALFSAFASVGRVLIGPLAGGFIQSLGWLEFYLFGCLLGLPALILLVFLQDRSQHNDSLALR